MKRYRKWLIVLSVLTILFFCLPYIVHAQPDPVLDPDAPIDGGIGLLIDSSKLPGELFVVSLTLLISSILRSSNVILNGIFIKSFSLLSLTTILYLKFISKIPIPDIPKNKKRK